MKTLGAGADALANCTLCYFQQFLKPTLELILVYFYWYLKKDVICVRFGTHTQTTV